MDGGSYRDPFEEDEDRDLTDEEKDAFDREGLHRSYPLTTLSRSHPTGPSYRHPSQAPPASRYVQSDASAPSLSRAPSEIGSVMSNGRSASRGYANSIRSGRTAAGKSFLSMRSSATTNRKAFVSTKLKGEVYKPWLERPDPAHRWARAIIIGSMVIGAAIAGLREPQPPPSFSSLAEQRPRSRLVGLQRRPSYARSPSFSFISC